MLKFASPLLDEVTIAAVGDVLRGSGISLGAQNAHHEHEGAFTGEVSLEMAKSCGATYVICGHSERRRLFKEDDGRIENAVRAALATGLRTADIATKGKPVATTVEMGTAVVKAL